jgi:hypothetical protein
MFCFTITFPILKCDLMNQITCFLFPNAIPTFQKTSTTLSVMLTCIYHIRPDQVDMKSYCYYLRQECLCNRVPEHGMSQVDCVWNVMAHAQKSDFVFRRNGQVHLNLRGRQFSRLLAASYASAIVMLDTLCSEVVWRVLATHSIRHFPLHFPSPCVTVWHHISTGL